MEDPEHSQSEPSTSSSATTSSDSPSSSSPSTLDVQAEGEEEEEEEEEVQQDEGNENENYFHHNHHHHHQHLLNLQQQQQRRPSILSYRVNISISDVGSFEMRDDVWSCLLVLVTFWFFASMTLILGFYGSVNLQLGPNCSRLIQTNPYFVQTIKAEEINGPKPGAMLYGFYKPPSLDVEITWTETHNAFVLTNFHKELVYFLNEGSKVDILYNVKSPSSLPLSLVIARGRDSLEEWIDDPSFPNTTLSWNLISGSGKIQQEISKPSNYYIAVGNWNLEEAEVELKLTITAILYNTTEAYYKCSLVNPLCSLKLFLLGTNVAVLTSPHHNEVTADDWYVKLSYAPRWFTYFVGSGVLTVLIVLAFRFCNMFQTTGEVRTEFEAGEVGSERAPLLLQKDDDISSWGSSYDSVSHDEEDLEQRLALSSLEGQPTTEGEHNNNPRRLCVICFDAPRDCFFLPCGHCAACFTCGTRIAEEACTCPICRRKMKKVRKIFTV